MHHTWERKLKNVRRFRRKLGVVSEENNTGERERNDEIYLKITSKEGKRNSKRNSKNYNIHKTA